MLRTGFDIKVTILKDGQKNKPDRLLAEAELVFKDGLLEGINLEGFGIWENKAQDGFNVTFPSKPSKKGFYDLFRPTTRHARAHFTDAVLTEFRREFAREAPGADAAVNGATASAAAG